VLRSAFMKNLRFWKDLTEPGRPGRVAYLINILSLIASFGFIVGLVLMWAVALGALIYFSMGGPSYNPN
jgi:hypothetical protein